MNLLLWSLFGIANGLLLNVLDKNPKKQGPSGAMFLGMFGAISGGTAAYVLFGGLKEGFNLTLLLVIFFEAIAIYLLSSNKNFHRI